MDPFRALARNQLESQAMYGVMGTGFGLFRQPASPPMLTQQVKGTGSAANLVTDDSGMKLFGIPLWIFGVGILAYALMSGNKSLDKPASKRDVMIWG